MTIKSIISDISLYLNTYKLVIFAEELLNLITTASKSRQRLQKNFNEELK